MRKLGIVIAASALIGTPAFAADMAVKAPPPAPAPVYNWTGWYVGVNAGASFGRAKTDFNGAPIFWGTTFGPLSPGFAYSDTESPDGFMGGGQIGYNWQYSPQIVVGLEADFQGAAEKDSATLTNAFSSAIGGFTNTNTTVTNYATKIDWFGTVRARIGYVWGNGNVLSYVTGGLAYGEVKINGTTAVSGILNAPLFPYGLTQAFGQSHVNTGWVVGYGTEGRLATPGWTWKVEGLYMDLGHLDTVGATTSSFISFILPNFVSGGQVTTHSHFTDGILRVGLNYQFH
jgi:outer membrane immunogenic protein